ncbi:hypothetical protein FACS1894199_17480 [Bacteroidia bacterium]|nr:hypothetical protein FACS1894199_17480 [Bacteroidia bacterium]
MRVKNAILIFCVGIVAMLAIQACTIKEMPEEGGSSSIIMSEPSFSNGDWTISFTVSGSPKAYVRGICYATHSSPTINDVTKDISFSPYSGVAWNYISGESVTLSGLSAGTYYVRAYVYFSESTVSYSSNEKKFTVE